MSVSAELNHNRVQWMLDSNKGVVTTPFHGLRVYKLVRQSQTSRRAQHCWKLKDQTFAFADDYVLLASSERDLQHALDRFSPACDKAGMTISTKLTRVICFFRNPNQCALQVSTSTAQQVMKFKYLDVVFTNGENGNKEFIPGLLKQTH